jgi:hypothetical protein
MSSSMTGAGMLASSSQVDRAAAPVLTAAGLVAHQLVDHAGRDTAVL